MSTDFAWLAGIIDGEGCITVQKMQHKTRRTPTYILTMKVSMTHQPTIDRIRSIMWCGWVSFSAAQGRARRNSWLWIAQARTAHEAIAAITPYLVTKKDQAEIALQFYDVQNDHIGGGRTVPQHVIDHREWVYRELRRLKREGIIEN